MGLLMELRSLLTLLILSMLCLAQNADSKSMTSERSLSRIFGGHEVYPKYSYPWQVSLQGRFGHFCGGSLVHYRFVLTAAHCVEELPSTDKVHELVVVVGDHNLQDQNEGSEINYRAKNITLHPNYVNHNNDWTEWDFAIIELDQHVSYFSVAQPICLPSPFDTRFTKETEFIATGWGATGKRPVSATLQEVSVRWFGNCQHVRPCKGCGFDEESTICTKGDSGKGTCPGDSGGPLVWYDPKIDMMKLIGVTSYGEKCGSTRQRPAAFAKVTAALDWIHKTMDGH